MASGLVPGRKGGPTRTIRVVNFSCGPGGVIPGVAGGSPISSRFARGLALSTRQLPRSGLVQLHGFSPVLVASGIVACRLPSLDSHVAELA